MRNIVVETEQILLNETQRKLYNKLIKASEYITNVTVFGKIDEAEIKNIKIYQETNE